MTRGIFFAALMIFCLVAVTASAATTDSYDWTGFYVGVEGGYGAGRTVSKSLDNSGTANPDMRGGFGGPFAGFNYQFDNRIVAGIETEGNFGNIGGDTDCPNPAFSCFGRIAWLGSTRVRAGYALESFLPYVTFGVAYGGSTLGQIPKGTHTELSDSRINVGWTPGAGLEYAVTRYVVARVAYVYYRLNSREVTDSFGERLRYRPEVHTVQFGVSLKFH